MSRSRVYRQSSGVGSSRSLSSKPAIRRTGRLGTGWVAGNEAPAEVGPVIEAIKKSTADHGRSIDHDHYGAGFHFRFGSWDDEISQRQAESYRRRSDKRDPKNHLAIGGAPEILARIEDYIAAGVSKFILRPIGTDDDDMIAQTHRLAAEVIPEVQGRPTPG